MHCSSIYREDEPREDEPPLYKLTTMPLRVLHTGITHTVYK
jgi:hypothetical protein